ncbi:hypothetical protein Pelo_15497 [Pelomyxa schiedti]|nr:hypothetical protein Pelo_15497 [Pelomyxa schiedti]
MGWSFVAVLCWCILGLASLLLVAVVFARLRRNFRGFQRCFGSPPHWEEDERAASRRSEDLVSKYIERGRNDWKVVLSERDCDLWCLNDVVATHNLDLGQLRSLDIGEHKRAAVIFFVGTFSPPHPGHLDALNQAKAFLTKNGFAVIGGYMSPSSNHYATRKLKRTRLESKHRINLCQLLVQKSGWLMIDTFECYHPLYHCAPVLMYHYMRKRITAQISELSSGNFDLFLLSGGDTGGFIPDDTVHQIIVLNRDGKTVSDFKMPFDKSMFANKHFFVVEASHMNISSTMIREKNAFLEVYREYPQILQYMNANHLLLPVVESTPLLDFSSLDSDDGRQQMVISLLTGNISSYPDCKIINVDFEKIGCGKGFRSHVFRLSNLRCAAHSGEERCVASHKLVVKMPYRHREDCLSSYYKREHLFYLKVAPSLISLRLPRCYLTAFVSPSSIQILEDLENALSFEFGKTDVDLSTMLLMVKSLAEFHALFWEHPGFGNSDDPEVGWLEPFDSPSNIAEMVMKMGFYAFNWKKSGHLFSSNLISFCKQYETELPKLIKKLHSQAPHSIVHGDLWIHNLCLLPNSLDTDLLEQHKGHSPPQLCLFDWQTVTYGNPITDLASLVDSCCASRYVDQCLDMYYDTLIRCGVSHNSFTRRQLRKGMALAKRWAFAYHIPVYFHISHGEKTVPDHALNYFFHR